MLKRHQVVGALAVGILSSSAALLVHCSPAEDTSVTIVTSCDLSKLDVNDPAEATVKLYAQTSTDLRDRTQKLSTRFTEICNAINRDLGLPEGADLHAACNRIAESVTAANAVAPTPQGGVAPVWVKIAFDLPCPIDGNAVAKCADDCSAKKGCDAVATCPKGQARGTCAGECGECAVTGDAVPCTGACTGDCAQLAAEAGAPACQGECIGKCKSPNWQGACSTGCASGFRGLCAGTCTGSCDGVAYDGGAPIDDGGLDGGDAGEASAPPGTGTCAGVCTGACTGEASGSCVAPCAGDFSGGLCPGIDNCLGSCVGVGVACTTTCKGTCASTSNTCAGTCNGSCNGTLSAGTCAVSPSCPEVNPICQAVCALRTAIATTCGPTAVDIRVAGDYKLPKALAAHAAEFSAAARDANLLSQNLSGVLQRTPGEFRAIGVIRDNARFCSTEAPKAYDEVRKLVNEVVGASLVVQGAKF
jgi:hypothetical protein